MPKGRGANKRRRSLRQKYPKHHDRSRGVQRLENLYARAAEAQKRRRKQ